ncbi:hypothetical protein BKA56DRAFT_570367 [Ilyonectria sp. MPI-CAGE-AT-0026]|nr:hypothetical protein BKA56DRAFT_570367 [Ilyonectria sp. MPI-CAGE-AT-0026]
MCMYQSRRSVRMHTRCPESSRLKGCKLRLGKSVQPCSHYPECNLVRYTLQTRRFARSSNQYPNCNHLE